MGRSFSFYTSPPLSFSEGFKVLHFDDGGSFSFSILNTGNTGITARLHRSLLFQKEKDEFTRTQHHVRGSCRTKKSTVQPKFQRSPKNTVKLFFSQHLVPFGTWRKNTKVDENEGDALLPANF